MTYKELKEQIEEMEEEQLNQDVTIFVNSEDEFYPVTEIDFATMNCVVLDYTHPFLVI